MLTGKTALITGSTSGIGLGIARSLAEQGCDIMLSGFGDAQEIEHIRKNLENEFSIAAKYYNVDLSKSNQAVELVQHTQDVFGSVDILVNNAGIQHVATIEDFPYDKWEAIMAVNLSSAFYTISEAVGTMKRNGWGRIINIASAHGLVASKNKSAYVAAKHGVIGLTKVVGLENAQHKITCNAICPGWVLTPLIERQIEQLAERKEIDINAAQKLLLAEKQPSERFSTASEIGAMVVYLCSEAAGNITATSLSIDGGWTAQ